MEGSNATLLSIGLQGDNVCNMLVLVKKRRSVRRNRSAFKSLILEKEKESSDSHVQNHQNDCLNKQGAQSGIVFHPTTYNMPPPPAVMSSQDYAYTTAALIKQDTGQ